MTEDVEVGTELVHGRTGARTVILATAASTAGAFAELWHTSPPRCAGPPRHLHPQQDELFTVLTGALRAVVGEEQHEVGPGEVLAVPRGTPHLMWTEVDEPTTVLWRTTPALRTDRTAVELWHVAAEPGSTPGPLDLWAVVQRYGAEFRLA